MSAPPFPFAFADAVRKHHPGLQGPAALPVAR